MAFSKLTPHLRKGGYYDMFIFYSRSGDKLYHPTGVKIELKYMTAKMEISKTHPSYFDHIKKITDEQSKLESIVMDYVNKYEEKPAVKYVKEQLEKPIIEVRQIRDSDFFKEFSAFLEYKSEVLKGKSINAYNSLEQGLQQFSQDKNLLLSFDIIDKEFLNKLINYFLYEKVDKTRVKKKRTGMNNNTVALRLKHFTEFLKFCKYEKEIQIDLDKIKYTLTREKKKKSIKSYEPVKPVINKEELEYLYVWEGCKPSFLKFRDVFVFCVKNGIRISDNNTLMKYQTMNWKCRSY